MLWIFLRFIRHERTLLACKPTSVITADHCWETNPHLCIVLHNDSLADLPVEKALCTNPEGRAGAGAGAGAPGPGAAPQLTPFNCSRGHSGRAQNLPRESRIYPKLSFLLPPGEWKEKANGAQRGITELFVVSPGRELLHPEPGAERALLCLFAQKTALGPSRGFVWPGNNLSRE